MNLSTLLSEMGSAIPLPLTFSLAALLLLSCWTDLRTRKIPNQFVLWGLVIAMGIRLGFGFGAVVDGILGATVMFVIGFILFLTKGFGGGDAKLLIAVGAFMGISHTPQAFAAIAIAGMLQAILFSLWHGMLGFKMYSASRSLLYLATFGRKGEKPSMAVFPGNAMPYALAIAAGSFYTLLP